MPPEELRPKTAPQAQKNTDIDPDAWPGSNPMMEKLSSKLRKSA